MKQEKNNFSGKMLVLFIVLVLMSSLALAAGQQGIHELGTGIESPEIKATGQGTGQGLEEGEVAGTGQGQKVNAETATQQQNKGEETQIKNQVQVQNKIKAGEYTSENGKKLQIQEQSNNKVQLKVGDASADTSMEIVGEEVEGKTKLNSKLSNGRNAEIKVMPDTASEKAMERLKINFCSEENECQIELKEVGQGEQVKAAYEVKVQKQARFLGLFQTRMNVRAQVDAETGEVIQSNKPWWAFLASETEVIEAEVTEAEVTLEE